jgi:hypothetical protein
VQTILVRSDQNVDCLHCELPARLVLRWDVPVWLALGTRVEGVHAAPFCEVHAEPLLANASSVERLNGAAYERVAVL